MLSVFPLAFFMRWAPNMHPGVIAPSICEQSSCLNTAAGLTLGEQNSRAAASAAQLCRQGRSREEGGGADFWLP